MSATWHGTMERWRSSRIGEGQPHVHRVAARLLQKRRRRFPAASQGSCGFQGARRLSHPHFKPAKAGRRNSAVRSASISPTFCIVMPTSSSPLSSRSLVLWCDLEAIRSCHPARLRFAQPDRSSPMHRGVRAALDAASRRCPPAAPAAACRSATGWRSEYRRTMARSPSGCRNRTTHKPPPRATSRSQNSLRQR